MTNTISDTLKLGHLTADLRNPSRSLEEALSEVDREISVRVRCFSRWVDDRKLASIDAKDRLERLIAAYQFLTTMLVVDARHQQPPDDPLAGPLDANSIPAGPTALTAQGN